MQHRSLRALSILTLLLAASPSFAQTVATPSVTASPPVTAAPPSAPDVVRTTDGSMYRGEIIEKVVGAHVTIRLVTGEIREIPWASVAASGDSPVVATPPPSKPTAPPADAEADANRVRVSFTATSPNATLERLGGSTSVSYGMGGSLNAEFWEPVCTAPCNVRVPALATYRVNGGGIVPSPSFVISDPSHPFALHATTGSRAARTGGAVLTGLGGLATLVGAGFTYISFALPKQHAEAAAAARAGAATPPPASQEGVDVGFRTGALITLGAGIALIGVGIYTLATSKTKVETTSAPSTPAAHASSVRLTPFGLTF